MPFFGVPIRNGLPIGLGSVAGFGVQQFDPSQLFAGGTVAGAWYDPSDLSTMFTTDAGTTPVAMPGGGAAVSVGRMLDKSGNGNHAIAFNNTTARPELRARVNLLTYSEEFDNGAWVKSNTTITANSIAAPDGTITADSLFETTANNFHAILPASTVVVASAGVSYKTSVYLKANGRTKGYLSNVSGGGFSSFDLSAKTNVFGGNGTNETIVAQTITELANGWFQLTVTSLFSGSANVRPTVGIFNDTGAASYTGDVTKGFYIWGADLRPANIGANVPAYQRIADANTYDTSGFPLYLRFDGIDDSMYTPANLNLSGTDKVAVFAGVRKLSDAAVYLVAETSSNSTLNAGAFGLFDPASGTSPNRTYSFRSESAIAISSPEVLAPTTYVSASQANRAAPSIVIRRDGVQVGSTTASQGVGNFGTYPLYIGSRNNASNWLNGQLYSLIIAGSAVSAGNISATEQWVAQKTGIAI